jgi:glycosyltransferase involved in cell wall biosynthesis
VDQVKCKISVVIPVYNNAQALQELTQQLATVLSSKFSSYEVIYVNDGSRDTSLELLLSIANINPNFKVIGLSRNFGQHPAICAGFEHATGDYIVLMDADLQDSPEDIPTLYEAIIKDDVDVIYTVKKDEEKMFASRISSNLYHFVFSKIIGTNVPLNIGTFRLFNRQFLDEIRRYKEVNILYGPLMFFIGFKSSYITLKYQDRKHGKSAYTFAKRLKLAVNSLISYTDIPHKLSTYFGSFILFGSLAYGAVVFGQYLFFGSSMPSGLTLIVFILSIMLGAIMLSLGIIGGYLFRVYQEVLSRPRYHVREKINFNE